jgi:hypothetical protein
MDKNPNHRKQFILTLPELIMLVIAVVLITYGAWLK